MEFLFLARLFRRGRNRGIEPVHRMIGGAVDEVGETPAAASSSEIEGFSGNIGGGSCEETMSTAASSGEGGSSKRALTESPPSDDVCPICFGSFDVPCRAPCGHWFCGGCILQYWNFSSALQPCKCPMCSQLITKLMPEASLYNRPEAEVSKVMKNLGEYNRLFVGGVSGLVLKLLSFPLYIKRMSRDLLNPDRPGLYLHELRLIALFLGVLYSFSPFDFLRIGRRNIIDVFDYSAFAMSFVCYLVGVYLRRRRARNVRELAEIQAVQDERFAP